MIGAFVLVLGSLPCAAGEKHAALAPPADDFEAPTGPPAATPAAWFDFCRRYKGECDGGDLPPVKLTLGGEAWDTLRSINELVNAAIEPMSDSDHWNVEDRWDYPDDGKGDCEDYVLLKRKLLIGRGFPRQTLLVTVVYRPEDQEGHAVLLVKSDAGDLILDNRRDIILLWNDTGYTFLKRQSAENQNRWVSFGNSAPAPL